MLHCSILIVIITTCSQANVIIFACRMIRLSKNNSINGSCWVYFLSLINKIRFFFSFHILNLWNAIGKFQLDDWKKKQKNFSDISYRPKINSLTSLLWNKTSMVNIFELYVCKSILIESSIYFSSYIIHACFSTEKNANTPMLLKYRNQLFYILLPVVIYKYHWI